MGKVWMLMINLRTGAPACNLTGDITVLQNLETEVWNRRNPPAADPFESFLSPGLTRSDHQSTQRLLYGPERRSASRRAISYQRGADELALTRVRSSARSPPSPEVPSQCQRDIPSWDTGRFSRLYNALFYPDPPFEMLRGAQQQGSVSPQIKSFSDAYLRGCVCVFFAWLVGCFF